MKSLVILGAGGAARELYFFVRDTFPDVRIAFVDDVGEQREIDIAGDRVPVVNDWDFRRLDPTGAHGGFRQFVIGVAEPPTKKVLVPRALAAGLEPAPTIVHPRALVRPDCTLGVGGVIVAHSQLTTHATLGDYVLVLDSTIGHHDVVGSYTTCYPGCRVSGDVVLGERVLLGAGTVIRPGVRIADGVVTGAMACVVKDILEPDVTVVGVPAKKLGT